MPRNNRWDEGIQSRVKECDSTERKKLSRWEIQAVFILLRASYEASKYRIFRPKERRH